MEPLSDELRLLLSAFHPDRMRNGDELPHPSEWSHVYELASYCHARHKAFDEAAFAATLQQRGFDRGNEIAYVYGRIRDHLDAQADGFHWKRRERLRSAQRDPRYGDTESPGG